MKNLTTYESFLEEGVNDPGILKAFFMAGGPGSGKSFVASEIFGFPEEALGSVSYRTGLKLVNNDNAFEVGLKKYGLSAGELANYAKDEEKWAEVMRIRDKSKGLTKRLQDNYIAGRLGQVIDGTGKNFNKIRGHRSMYKILAMILIWFLLTLHLKLLLKEIEQENVDYLMRLLRKCGKKFKIT